MVSYIIYPTSDISKLLPTHAQSAMNLLSNYGASEIIWMRENWTNDTSNPSDQSQFGYKFYERYVILTIFIPILVLAVLGNISVILSFCKDKRLRTPTNFPLISLSISDLLVASFTFPLSIVYKLTGRWYFGNAMCIVWLCSDYIATSTSVLSLIIVTFDRYVDKSMYSLIYTSFSSNCPPIQPTFDSLI